MLQELLDDIIRGKADGELESDLVTLCWLGFLIVVREEDEEGGGDDSYFSGILERIGKILCPLGDDLKPRKYQDEMRNVRLQYTGITFDPVLQFEYSERITSLARDGLLSSIVIAVENEIWQQLAQPAQGYTA